jgi:FkbM family methyltransferase
MNDYSQYGEGNIINSYFKDKIGTCVSLGENDGKTLSNVLGLIEAGWSAFLVEPSSEAFSKLSNLHKSNVKVKCFNFAIGDYDGETTFYHSGTHLNKGDTSLLSTINKEELKRWGDTCKFTETKVPIKKWDTFIKIAEIKNIDFISIDCEGVDFEILSQINFNDLSVKMICVEHNSINSEIYEQHMFKYNYKVHYKNSCNLIFVK